MTDNIHAIIEKVEQIAVELREIAGEEVPATPRQKALVTLLGWGGPGPFTYTEAEQLIEDRISGGWS